jgi:hypothetical protein
MDVPETVAAILRTFHDKACECPRKATDFMAEAQQRILLVYYTAFSQTNDTLLEYLPPFELPQLSD